MAGTEPDQGPRHATPLYLTSIKAYLFSYCYPIRWTLVETVLVRIKVCSKQRYGELLYQKWLGQSPWDPSGIHSRLTYCRVCTQCRIPCGQSGSNPHSLSGLQLFRYQFRFHLCKVFQVGSRGSRWMSRATIRRWWHFFSWKKRKQSKNRLHVFASSSVWFIALIGSVMIGQSNYFDFDVTGATLRWFRAFLAQTILELVVANLIHSEHYLWTSKGRW